MKKNSFCEIMFSTKEDVVKFTIVREDEVVSYTLPFELHINSTLDGKCRWLTLIEVEDHEVIHSDLAADDTLYDSIEIRYDDETVNVPVYVDVVFDGDIYNVHIRY